MVKIKLPDNLTDEQRQELIKDLQASQEHGDRAEIVPNPNVSSGHTTSSKDFLRTDGENQVLEANPVPADLPKSVRIDRLKVDPIAQGKLSDMLAGKIPLEEFQVDGGNVESILDAALEQQDLDKAA